jgi:hypothetical protein
MFLLCSLVLYNDPLCSLEDIVISKGAHQIVKCIFESTYISLQLFFWILVVHSVAQVSKPSKELMHHAVCLVRTNAEY